MGHKVFITGAGGYLGGVLSTGLSGLSDVDCITAMIHNKPFRNPVSPKVNVLKMDIRSPELVDAVAGHDVVIHTSHVVYWPAKMPASTRDDINLNGARNIARAALQNGVSSLIHASSIAAYDPEYIDGRDDIDETAPVGNGTSRLYYWNSKALAEKMMNEVLDGSNTTITHFRIGYVLGPRDQSEIQSFRQNALLVPGRYPRLNFVHEDDLVSAGILALRTKMPGVYNVVSDRTVGITELFEAIDAKPIKAPLWLATLITMIRWRFFGSIIHPSWVASVLIDFVVSNKKLKTAGWKPHCHGIDIVNSAVGANHFQTAPRRSRHTPRK